MKHEITKQQYYSMILSLIYFRQQIERIFVAEDLSKIDSLIEVIRWYAQFIKQ